MPRSDMPPVRRRRATARCVLLHPRLLVASILCALLINFVLCVVLASINTGTLALLTKVDGSRDQWPSAPPDDWPPRVQEMKTLPDEVDAPIGYERVHATARYAPRSGHWGVLDDTLDETFGMDVTRVGWPLKSMEIKVCWHFHGAGKQYTFSTVKPRWTRGLSYTLSGIKITIPVVLRVGGFLANTAIVFALLYSLSILYIRIVRRWRSSSGRCTNCGYVISASLPNCPECGLGFAET